jgi:N-acetylmuramic acid 6-phosphate etherase
MNDTLPPTERIDPNCAEIDSWPIETVLETLVAHQAAAIAAVRIAIPQLARAIAAAGPGLASGGRLIYVGAGTSGRLGAQDGAELTPTFSWPRARSLFVIAGGDVALTRAVEGAEDDAEEGARRLAAIDPRPEDVIIALAASGTTPFVRGALTTARAAGALTIAIACNPRSPMLDEARCPVLLDTGPEAIAGSTRLKAGTAQKAALNLLSTTLMIRLGRVYRGLMVEMQATNAKLRARAERIIMRLAGGDVGAARDALEAAGGDLKRAILMRLDGIDAEMAAQRLAAAGGRLRAARHSANL